MAVSSLFCVGLIGVAVAELHELDDVLNDKNRGHGVAKIGPKGCYGIYDMKRCHAEKVRKESLDLPVLT